jgi:hypothetical protein
MREKFTLRKNSVVFNLRLMQLRQLSANLIHPTSMKSRHIKCHLMLYLMYYKEC